MSKQSSGDHTRRLRELIALLLLLCGDDTQDLIASSITAATWARRIQDSLEGAHASAAALGRSAAFGASQPVTEADKILGKAIAAQDSLFLHGFREDIESGRYTDDAGELREKAIAARLHLYGNKLRATANQAFAEASDPGTLYLWLLDDDAHHCSGNHGVNCPDIAKGSPYTVSSMPTWPGDGATPCGTNCRCSVRRLTDDYAPFEEV